MVQRLQQPARPYHVTNRVDRKGEARGKSMILPPPVVALSREVIHSGEPLPCSPPIAGLFKIDSIMMDSVNVDFFLKIKRADPQSETLDNLIRSRSPEPGRE